MESSALVRAVLVLSVLTAGGFGVRAYLNRDARAAPGKEAGGKEGEKGGPGGDKGKDAADRVVPVLVTQVVQRDMPIYLDGLGNVTAVATVTVRPQVDGRLDQVLFKEGQEVHKGDVLAQIDPRPFTIQLHSASAAFARDRAQLDGARKNLDRYQALAKDGLATQQQVDDQHALVAQLEGTTATDQAQIESARLSLDYARITSPVDGVTGIRLVDPGNVVHQADPNGIVVITSLDPIAVIFTLPQDQLGAISKEFAQGPINVEATSRDGRTNLATGSLALIDNQINTATATIRLKALFPNKDRGLWPNQFVKTRLLLSTRKNALVIPAAVVQHGPQGDFAYVIDADQKAAVRPIQVDVTEGDQVVIASGLSAGDQVVLDGQNQLRPGSKTAPRTSESKDSKQAGEGKQGGEGKHGGEGKEGKKKDGAPRASAVPAATSVPTGAKQ